MRKYAMVLVVAAAAACGRADSRTDQPAAPVPEDQVVVVRDTTVADVFEASGIAEPVQRAMVASKLMARVTDVTVAEGDRVAAGQVLVRLDGSDLEAKRSQTDAGLAAAEAAYQEASAQTRRMRALYADSAAPKATLDAAEAGLARAEAAVRQARAAGAEVDAAGSYATLRAPFAGVVTQRLVDLGAFAAPGVPLVVVEDPSTLRIVVTAPTDAARGIRRGQRLEAVVAGQRLDAVVEGAVPAPGGHVMTVNALVPNRDQAMMAGSAATLRLPVGSRRALMVPAEAIIREGDLTGVRVRTGSGTDLRWVRLGPSAGGMVEVLSGLNAGDQVVMPVVVAEGR